MSKQLPDLSLWSEAQLREDARSWRGNVYAEGTPGDCDPDEANWRYVENFPLSFLQHHGDDWQGWLEGEIRDFELAGDDRGYRAMLGEPIVEAIVVLMVDGKGYIWDGWHRTAASIVSGRTHIKAIVGTPYQQEETE
jgi:hypothetical protein